MTIDKPCGSYGDVFVHKHKHKLAYDSQIPALDDLKASTSTQWANIATQQIDDKSSPRARHLLQEDVTPNQDRVLESISRVN